MRRKARRRLLNFSAATFQKYRPSKFHHILCTYLDRVASGEIKRLMVFAPPQFGKLLADDTPVLTLNGWSTHGELVPGDFVFGRDGKPVEVLAVSQPGVADYEVEFTDGAVVRCHGRHEWVVFDRSHHRPVEMILETMEIERLGTWKGERGRGGRARFQVDANVPLAMPESVLGMPPYVLGAWLGDGSTTKNCLTHHSDDKAVVSRVESLGIERTAFSVHKKTGVHVSYFRSLYGLLMSAGLMGDKRIPSEYLLASEDQRLELLAGLIDTDGYVYHKNGRVAFSNTDKRLVDSVADLVRSLGWRVSVSATEPALSTSGIQGRKVCYQACFNPTRHLPLALPRKKTVSVNPAVRRRGIVEIRRCEPRVGKCIQVEGGVYLVGKTLIPTHNSEVVSRRFPAYMLGLNPDLHVLGCSYAHTLASKMNRDVQRCIESGAYAELFPATRLSGKQTRANTEGKYVKNADEFEIVEHRGSYRSAGVGAGIVGNPADLIVIDDPVAGVDQAYSPTYRQKLWDWYGAEASTRQSPDCRIVLMHQRWHEDDLAGRLLKVAGEDPKADQWTVVRFPALAYPKDSPLRCPEDWRSEGEPLWPEKFPKEFIEARRATMSPFQYAAVYDQNPQPLKGAYFQDEWFGRWNPFSDGWWILAGRKVQISACQIIVVVDPAAREKQHNDYTGMGAFALTKENDLLVLEMIEDHIKIENIPACVLALCQRWNASKVLYEDSGFQIGLVKECRRTQYMPPVIEVSPQSRSKLVRATEAINRAASRQIWLPDDAPWVASFIDEAIRFTGMDGGKDNLIDCLAYAALMQTRKLDQTRQGAGGTPYVHETHRVR